MFCKGAPRRSQGAEQLGVRSRRAKESTKPQSHTTRSECREQTSWARRQEWGFVQGKESVSQSRGPEEGSYWGCSQGAVDEKQISTYRGTTAGGRVWDEIRSVTYGWGFPGEIPCETGVGGLCITSGQGLRCVSSLRMTLCPAGWAALSYSCVIQG